MCQVNNLHPNHRNVLTRSGVADEVIDARGYSSLNRTTSDDTPRATLKRLGFSKPAYDDDRRFPGLLIPLWSPVGKVAAYQYRPDHPRKDAHGKFRKYESPQGRSAVLDVHPFNRDRIADPTVELWITEGVKKGDALTSRGLCVVTLSGVYNWRSSMGTLGDWEDVALRGRTVVLAFDTDAGTNRNVARAMARLGAWLRAQGATARYIVCPQVGDDQKSGVDDFLAAGGTVDQLRDAITTAAPDPDAGDDSLTDSRLAERIADDSLVDRFRYCPPLGGWLQWNGTTWEPGHDEVAVMEVVRRALRDMLVEAAQNGAPASRQRDLAGLQSRNRISAITALTRGIDGIYTNALEFLEDPHLLNCGNGVVDLRTGELQPHDPARLMLRHTPVPFVPGATHPDWDKALNAFADDATCYYVQTFLGTGACGTSPADDTVEFWTGRGENGKTTIVAAAMQSLGTYSKVVSSKLIGGSQPGHPTLKFELFGLRLAVIEELQEGHRLDEARVKEITGSAAIEAHRMRENPVTWSPTHTLIVSTNHRPLVVGVDRGIWRRLVQIPFPRTFGPGTPNRDDGLRDRVRNGRRQQEAVLAWLVEGARRYYESGMPPVPEAVADLTADWRRSADSLLEFLAEQYESCAGGSVELINVAENYNMWSGSAAMRWSPRLMRERLEESESIAAEFPGLTFGKDRTSRRTVIFGLQSRSPYGSWTP